MGSRSRYVAYVYSLLPGGAEVVETASLRWARLVFAAADGLQWPAPCRRAGPLLADLRALRSWELGATGDWELLLLGAANPRTPFNFETAAVGRNRMPVFKLRTVMRYYNHCGTQLLVLQLF